MSFINYILFRLVAIPLSLLPYRTIHFLGNKLGLALYYLYPKYRKRALSNLALASDLKLSPEEIVCLAKESLQNLMITSLEYPKLAREKDISRIATCDNPEPALEIIKSGKGIIFFCGHQANWEVLFLEGTSRMPGVAIGRPITNRFLYNWVVKIRQKYGGKIIPPQNALKEGLRALKAGSFLGIVGDQGMPNSGYSSPFFGRKAWTSPLPALLSSRTGCPIMVAMTRRVDGKYRIRYSDPIWPKEEIDIDGLMRPALSYLEQSIQQEPSQWLWIHNRWKQQLPGRLPRRFRQEAISIVFPEKKELLDLLPRMRELYPTEFLTAFIPETLKGAFIPEDIEVKTYKTIEDILTTDYRFKLVFNFTDDKRIRSHFLNLSAFNILSLRDFNAR